MNCRTKKLPPYLSGKKSVFKKGWINIHQKNELDWSLLIANKKSELVEEVPEQFFEIEFYFFCNYLHSLSSIK